ncbi:MAG: DUF445 family protein [Ruminococcus sp.]|nr:DUF445 family protein [Ruminococcus sp.]
MAFEVEYIAAPVIGSVIGYFTNYLAVKMLFRPLKPVKIGNFTLPFTPGIIPKGRDRLAKAIGGAVGNSLLTDEVLQETLLSDAMMEKVSDAVDKWISENRENETPLRELLESFTGSSEQLMDGASELISEKILKKANEIGVGRLVAEQVASAVREKIQGTMFAMMLNDSVVENLSGHIANAVDRHISEHGEEIIKPRVKDEVGKFMEKPAGSLVASAEERGADIKGMVLKIYKMVVETKLSGVMDTINIPGIIENKINSMDMLEIEQLTLSVMKKELDAIVWLGAVIGFVLGLFNLFF